MPDRIVKRGDSYDYEERPLFAIDLSTESGGEFPLGGRIIRSTFKPAPDDDDTDSTAVIKAEIRFDDDGNLQSSDGLVMDPGTPGRFLHYLTSEESRDIPVGTKYVSDVQLSRWDAALGKEVGVYTFTFTDTLVSEFGITNREATA